MDVFFHLVLGMIISKTFLGRFDFIVVLASLLPDLIGSSYLYILLYKNSSKKSLKLFIKDYFKYVSTRTFFGKADRTLYRATHNLLAWIFFSGICYIFFRETYLIISLSYLSHLIADFFVHTGDYATRLLYPFSDFHMIGKDWNHNPKIYLTIDIALLTVLLVFSIR